eukprot:2955725-Amphidinium_carterae.2
MYMWDECDSCQRTTHPLAALASTYPEIMAMSSFDFMKDELEELERKFERTRRQEIPLIWESIHHGEGGDMGALMGARALTIKAAVTECFGPQSPGCPTLAPTAPNWINSAL